MTLSPTYRAGLVWQYENPEDPTGWTTFFDAADLGTLVRTRRFAAGPRRGQMVTRIRLVKTGGPDYEDARFSFDQVKIWREGSALSPVRVFGFSFDDDAQTYFHVRTDQNIEVYRRDLRMASIPAPHLADQVTTVQRAAVLDTLLQFHPDVQTHRVTRQGAHDEWDARPLTYLSVPLFDYLGDRAGGRNEIQQLRFKDYDPGDTFNITVEGEVTDSIVYAAGDNSAAIQAALEALVNIGDGGVEVTLTATDTYEIEFVGENRNQDVAEIGPRTIVSIDGLAIGATLQQGQEGGEAIISNLRGWPATGAFYQGRLFVGGLRSRPQTILGSRVGDWFNFKSLGQATCIAIDLDTDETTTVRTLFPGDRLQAFTSSSEFWFAQEPIVPPPPVRRTTRRGVAEGVPIYEISGSAMFVPAGGQALCEFNWDDAIQGYRADFISKFATHLLAGPDKRSPVRIIDVGFRRAKTPEEADRAILIRDDGRAAVMHALRQDEVTGFVRWATDGRYLAAGADLARTEMICVERDTAAGPEIFLERVDELAILDSQVSMDVTAPGGVTEIGGLSHLEGRSVAVFADGADRGDAVVTGGVARFGLAALRDVSAGLNFTCRGRTLPIPRQADPRAPNEANERTAILSFEILSTTPFKAGMAGGRMWDVKFGLNDIADEGPGENPFTGWGKVEAVPGFRAGAQCEFVQDRPGLLEILQIAMEVET